ncbi:hypothetical protein CEE37_10175 [candidate division LCP-89 bacterium B3_LCP]|uniref:Radical SAM core domain-containing protein n=1 Tax=candidate division LCP-89 bacterium B3_LCP TaxID=2012998 RepID=A0A532UYQ2_UNCL8|nr:MAG: hypothetical protein CEE37_10175 [candidate division LCP-89 bacterium B3_LCP]
MILQLRPVHHLFQFFLEKRAIILYLRKPHRPTYHGKMKNNPNPGITYRFNVLFRIVAKELLRAFYHFVYRPLRPSVRFHCRNIFEGRNALIFANGEVTCVCADHGLINLGNVNDSSVEDIWKGKGFEDLRKSFRNNRLPLRHCAVCFAFEKIKKPSDDIYDITPFFWNTHIETTPVCNLECAICRRDEVEKHRGNARLSPDTVYRMLDEIIKHKTNKFVLFFGFGEPFLDKNIYDYVSYLKERFPEVIVSISTNGIPLDNENNVEKLLNTPLDIVLFSVDGITQEEYVKYRKGGDLKRALSAMERLVNKRQTKGLAHPYIVWQYLYFRWNDSDKSLRATVNHARKIGVDLLHFLPTRTPITGISWKNVLRRDSNVMYKFGSIDHDYNPHGRSRVIQVTDDMEEIPL